MVVTGILARDDARFQAAQKNLRHAARPFSDVQGLIASGPQAALVLLPNHLHFETAKQALEAGLHVFCEKPLTNTVPDALALQAIAKRSGRVLMADFNQRYFDRNRVLEGLIAENRIGKIVSVQAFHNQDLRGLKSFAPLHRDITGGGVVHNAGIHFINLLLHWFGLPEKVRAVFENRALPATCGEDTARCEFWFPGGAKATLEASLAGAADTTYERVEFHGAGGNITSDLKKCEIRLQTAGKAALKVPCRAEIISDSVFHALEHFADCVRKNLRPETDVEDFIRTMKTVDALTLSAQRGEEVRWTETDSHHAH